MDLNSYKDDLSKNVFPDGKLYRVTFDPTVRKFRLLCKNSQNFDQIRHSFSIENQSAFFVQQYGYKSEPRLYAINKFGYFSYGLIFEIFEWFKSNYGTLDVLAISKSFRMFLDEFIMPLKQFLYKENGKNLDVSNVSEDNGKNNELRRSGKTPFEYRDYQKASVQSLIEKGYGRGLIEIPTAGGKSFILANFIWNICKNFCRNCKTLILVPNKQLVEQFYKDLIDYGYSKYQLSKFTAGLKKTEQFNPDASIIIANRQYVFKNKSRIPNIDILICDECHQCCAESTAEFIEQLDAKLKIGCSGTIPRDKMMRWKLIGMFGRIVYTEDIVKLQKQGFISKLKITSLQITDSVVENDRNLLFNLNPMRKYHADEFGYSEIAFNDAHDAEHDYYAKHYSELYKPVLEYLNTQLENTLVLFDRIEVGKNLYDLAQKTISSKSIHYIDGSIDVSQREAIRSQLENSGNNILFAEIAVFSTGINIKRLTNIVFACGTKSFSQVIQAIGRTLRLHSTKSEAHLIDVSFNFKYSQKHYAERLKIYKDMYHKKPDEILKFKI